MGWQSNAAAHSIQAVRTRPAGNDVGGRWEAARKYRPLLVQLRAMPAQSYLLTLPMAGKCMTCDRHQPSVWHGQDMLQRHDVLAAKAVLRMWTAGSHGKCHNSFQHNTHQLPHISNAGTFTPLASASAAAAISAVTFMPNLHRLLLILPALPSWQRSPCALCWQR